MNLPFSDNQSETDVGFTQQALAKLDLDTSAFSIASLRCSDNLDTVKRHPS